MIKLTFTLAAALYAGFVIWGQPETSTSIAAVDSAPAGSNADFLAPVVLNRNAQPAQVTRSAVGDGGVPDASVIAASAPEPTSGSGPRLIGEPVVVNLIEPAAPVVVTAPQDVDPDRLFRVTGSRVNMRSGPSTSNRVVDSLPGGTLAEAISEETDGWIEIRDTATGKTGFMSVRFLEPA
ncbi:SH3 domain-containing protein [Jannaschia pohangensis]|uniref:SH3 domain-containing protein n=1 Tax=Jannaschia pohangensis TaxID=390807 RepID=A0A1I3LER8_9RHOB|nr:SH3 domain-containing protein [Jannaschia pohangensis]SFI83262.1 SH3 domain-containing protein [Jannaschia pohangensis]